MNGSMDLGTLRPCSLSGPLHGLEAQAASFIRSFAWSGQLLEMYEGFQEPDILGVFLVKLKPARPHVDEWLWVVVGDLPAYFQGILVIVAAHGDIVEQVFDLYPRAAFDGRRLGTRTLFVDCECRPDRRPRPSRAGRRSTPDSPNRPACSSSCPRARGSRECAGRSLRCRS